MKPRSHESVEQRLHRYYVGLVDALETPPLWERIQHQLRSEPGRSVGRPHPLRRVVSLASRVVAGTACAILLLQGSFYVAPRWQHYAYAFAQQQGRADANIPSVLMDDPGLLGLFQRGAFHPLNLAVSRNGITLRVLDFYADGNRTVLVYKVDGPAAPANVLVMRPWNISTGNWDEVSTQTLSGQSAPAVRTFQVYLRDQFGLVHRYTRVERKAQYGYLEFPAVPRVMRDLGLRLTLHVEAMDTVLAEHGLFGERTFQYQTGPWDLSFVALPEPDPVLQMAPGVSAVHDGTAVTLTSVRVSESQTRITLSTTDFDADGGPSSPTHIEVETPGGQSVLPTEWTQSGDLMELRLPPLRQGGTYTLVVQRGGKTWRLPWNQPGWSRETAAWFPASNSHPIYEGTDLSKAVSLVDFPVHLPPDGWRLERVTVTPDFRPILSGSPAATPNSVQMTLSGPNGVRVVMTVSRTFVTPVPYFESLAAFQKSLSQSEDSPISDFEQGDLDGMVTHMWTFQTKTRDSRTPQTMPLVVLYVYPHWGSVEVSPVADQSGDVNEVILKAMLVELARSWLASPIVKPSS